jgi:polyphosphate glucokinase
MDEEIRDTPPDVEGPPPASLAEPPKTPLWAVGVDVGGTGVKAAIVDIASGMLISSRIREKTPIPSTPAAVAETTAAVLQRIDAEGYQTVNLPTAIGLPGVVHAGDLLTAANIDRAWIGAPAARLFSERLQRPVSIINDADAAGLAEMRFGAGRGKAGVVLLLTLGTGIGSALFVDGRLVPNTEFGHLEFHGRGAETLLSGAARERRKLSWKRWAKEFNVYLGRLDLYFTPDLLILGGGVSKESARFLPYFKTRMLIVIAELLNSAGIVGAAMAAAEETASSAPPAEETASPAPPAEEPKPFAAPAETGA